MMFTRTVTFTGTTDIQAGVRFLRDEVAPLMREHHGYRGIFASVDRDARVFGVLSLWETEADRDASESALATVRKEAQELIGGDMSVETYEEFVWEVAEPPSVGSWLLLQRVSMDAAKVDENIDFFRREVLPQIKAAPGFRAVRNMINRQTGAGLTGTLWADRDSMEAAAQFAETRQQNATRHGITFGERSRREIVFVELPS